MVLYPFEIPPDEIFVECSAELLQKSGILMKVWLEREECGSERRL